MPTARGNSGVQSDCSEKALASIPQVLYPQYPCLSPAEQRR